MCLKVCLVIFQVVFAVVVSCDKSSSRKARLFTFNTEDDDIRIDLEFTVPFISIPVKRTVDAAFGSHLGLPTININPASLALAGVIVLATTVLLPSLLKSYVHDNPHQRYSKLLQAAEFKGDDMLDFATQMLEARSVRGCALRVACWAGQTPDNADHIKMWNQLLSNQLLSSIVNGTALEDAMAAGRGGRECGSYGPCPLRARHLPALVANMALLSNGLLHK